MFKRILKAFIWPLRLVALVCLLLLVFLLSAEAGGRITVNRQFQPTADGIDIFVISNGIHTDIAVPYHHELKNWESTFSLDAFTPPVDKATAQSYIAFGWGDRGLYEKVPTWADLTVAITVESMLWPTESAMHVTFYPGPPKLSDWVRTVRISEAQYLILISEIERSFAQDAAGRPISLNCCWYGHIHDSFYGSRPSYHLLRTCNNWTNRVLKKTGVPTALWTPRHEHILRHLPAEG